RPPSGWTAGMLARAFAAKRWKSFDKPSTAGVFSPSAREGRLSGAGMSLGRLLVGRPGSLLLCGDGRHACPHRISSDAANGTTVRSILMTAPQQFSPLAATPPEHAALLESPGRFDSLRRKSDFLDDGVAAVFGIQGVEARLQAVLFQADRFTPGEAEQWL